MTWEFKLEPTPEQVIEIEHTLTVCRKVWNFALRERKDWLNSRKCSVNACSLRHEYIMSGDEPFPGYHLQAKRLTLAKKEISELKSVNAQMLQQVLRQLDASWERWLTKQSGLPRFKNQARMRSFVFPQMLKHPLSVRSTNRSKLLRKIARVHQRIADTRKDWHFKTAHQLCDQGDAIFIEDLDFRIIAKGFLGKHTLDAGLGQFTNQILPWVCWKRDVHYGKVDPRGTSQECPDCGATVKKDLSVRISHCLECGSIKPRDIAAAQVICTRGQRGIEKACGVEVTGGQ